ncbi:MAG: hypothetical protein EZS28_028302 [Streblomastix strix]|uniref:Uncharacterized protein n=1 Tax=Streblomastix strix TaxID=222440 RepID=A0A5J4V267_9EUKA|nr:MAG: hypothetical protein EZS28_028302 [Streblomastix strix]
MALIRHVKALLETNNQDKHDIQSSILKELNFTYNSIILLIGQRGSGKTYNIPTKIVPYAEVNGVLDELIEGKQAYDQVVQLKIEKFLEDDSKQNILDKSGANEFKIKSPHTIVLFDDAMSIFKNKKSPPFKKLFKNRQPTIIYFLCLQDIIGLEAAIKSKVDSIYFFGAFNRQKFNLFFNQSSIPIDKEELCKEVLRYSVGVVSGSSYKYKS